MIKAVIFDMDGTLIDTEKYYRICWPAALAYYGYEMSDEQALTMRSLGRPFSPRYLKDMFQDPDLDYYTIREKRKELFEELVKEQGIQVKPGAEEILTYLREKGIITAIATASDLERTKRYLTMVNLQDYFEKLISATMVKVGKPAPDVYLYACQQLGLKPEECLAVEDSPNGVRSAYQAGLQVVMVPDQDQPDEEISAMLWAKPETLADLISLLESCQLQERGV